MFSQQMNEPIKYLIYAGFERQEYTQNVKNLLGGLDGIWKISLLLFWMFGHTRTRALAFQMFEHNANHSAIAAELRS